MTKRNFFRYHSHNDCAPGSTSSDPLATKMAIHDPVSAKFLQQVCPRAELEFRGSWGSVMNDVGVPTHAKALW